jgi:hypothetical protein
MLNMLFRAFAFSALALKTDSWLEKIFRRMLRMAYSFENTIAFQANRIRLGLNEKGENPAGTNPQESDETLLAVYCLKGNPLTFDFVTFLGIVELERNRRGLSRSKVIVYAPPEFPVYQWQRQKVFNNMDGKPLICAERKHVLGYVRKLADAARVFPTSMRCEVTGNRQELFAAVASYPHVFPSSSKWTGNFQNMTLYKTYSALKFASNADRDAVVGYRHYRLGEWLSDRIGSGKLIATVNFRNQTYSTLRNASLEDWEEFFSHPFIKKHFHFIAFNDAETPVILKDAECITFCDRYIHDNFRRFKTFLSVGLHIGTVSGSAAIVTYSDVPYLMVGRQAIEDMNAHLDPRRALMEGDLLMFDRERNYQLCSFRRDQLMEDVHLLLINIFHRRNVLERYPKRFQEKLAEILRDWP